MDSDGPDIPTPALIERSIDNASSVLRALLPGGKMRSIHDGVGDVLIGASVFVLVQALALAVTGPAFTFLSDLRFAIGLFALFALVICVVAWAFGKGSSVPTLVTGVLWAMSLGRLAGLLVETAFGLTFSLVGEFVTLGITALPAILFALVCLGPTVGGVAAAVGLAALLVFNIGGLSASTNGEVSEVFSQVEPEDLFAAQSNLLSRQLLNIRAGEPDKPELFAILGAGDPFQRVFAREVDAVTKILASEFNADARIVRLVNSAREPLAAPLLSRQNLTAAVKSLREQMQADDILLLFLTSHGRPDRLDTEFSPFIRYSLSSGDIAPALEGVGENPTIVVISACYSGSFADALTAPNRLVITAADADSVSFGCDDQNEWTEWGRAFWVDAMSQTRDPREAALLAQKIVAEREVAQELPPSDPMIVEGAAIGPLLDRWLETLN